MRFFPATILVALLCISLGALAGAPTQRVAAVYGGSQPDPLRGISFALRLQTCKGYGSTPYAPLGLYKDTACTIPATQAGDSIAAWRDELSGSGLIATQATSSKRPTLQFVNGKPVLRFDGVDDVLTRGALNVESGCLIVATFSRRSTGTGDVIGGGSGALSMGDETNSTAGLYVAKAGVSYVVKNNAPDTSWQVASVTVAGTAVSLWKNGTLVGSATVTFGAATTTYIGSQGISSFGSTDITALIVGVNTLPRAQIEAFEVNLRP